MGSGEPLGDHVGIERRLEEVERSLRSQLNAQQLDPVWLPDACLQLVTVCRRQQLMIDMLAKRVHQIEQQRSGGDGA